MKKGIFLFAMLLCLCSCNKTKTLKEFGGLYFEVEFKEKKQSKELIDETVKIIKNRIEGNCEYDPVVEYDPKKQIISIQLPLENDSLLFSDLVTTRGQFSICEVADNNEVHKYLKQIDSIIVKENNAGISINDIPLQSNVKIKNSIPLYTPNDNTEPALYIHPSYIMGILIHFRVDKVTKTLPHNVNFMFGKFLEGDFMLLYTLKKIDESKAITNAMIDDTKIGEKFLNNYPISINLKSEYYNKWAKLTKENINKNIAIVIDNEVISCFKVNNEITDGKLALISKLNLSQTTMLSNILKYGDLKSDLRINKIEVIRPY